MRGLPVKTLYLIMLGLIALAVVVLIRSVGLILVVALLTIPASISERFTGSLKKMMVLATLLAAAFTLSGLALSYVFNLSSGATIILVAGAAFFASRLKRNGP